MTRHRLLPLVLALAVVVCGGAAAWMYRQAAAIRESDTARNTALVDPRSGQITAQVSDAIGSVFSYSAGTLTGSQQAARQSLTGAAASRYEQTYAAANSSAAQQGATLSTTVTDTGMIRIEGDRAFLLVFADQARTQAGKTSYGVAMFTVNAVWGGGRWRIDDLETV